MPEAAVYRVFILVTTRSDSIELSDRVPYSNHRWVGRRRDLEEITFATDPLRQIAAEALQWATQDLRDDVP